MIDVTNNQRKTYRTWLIDSRRWDDYRPRKNDIIVATYPKSGTTWVQRIVSLLVFQSLDVIQLDYVFPWWERRTGASTKDILRDFEIQTHQRSIKTHLPLDGLPVYDEVKYIHVVRDGRDVAMSYHNHCYSHTAESVAHLDRISLTDETLLREYPEIPSDPADFFHNWLTRPAIDGEHDGSPFLSYVDFESTYAKAVGQDNFLFIHYSDLKSDLVSEMQKLAEFLNISLSRDDISKLAVGASFQEMQKNGDNLIPMTTKNFINGATGFFNSGCSGRWNGIFRDEDLCLFNEKISSLPKSYAKWLLEGNRSL